MARTDDGNETSSENDNDPAYVAQTMISAIRHSETQRLEKPPSDDLFTALASKEALTLGFIAFSALLLLTSMC